MKKRGIISLIFLILLISLVSPLVLASVDSEIEKITHYAEEYETGNINYVKLMLYISSAREGLNEILGAKSKQMGGIVKQEQIQKILGEPNEKTKWVWVEGEEHDAKLDEAVPVWKKIVFDGKKIQIRMEAFPSIFKKHKFEDGFEEEWEEEMPKEGDLIYRLHFDVEFKKPQEQLDIKGKIDEIQALAESEADMETLAKESVNAEMIFNNYFRQGNGKCEDIMKSIFGSENQRQTQQILLQEIEFCGGDNFEGIIRLEMCDDCEWNYINLDFHFEGRGPGFKSPKDFKDLGKDSREDYKDMDSSSFMTETTELINEMQRLCQEGDHGQAMAYSQRLRMLTEAWNQKANDVWEEIEKEKPNGKIIESNNNNQDNVVENTEVKSDTNQDNVVENTITGNFITGYVIEENNNQQSEENNDPYWWIKQDQLQRQKAKDLRKQNYESRKTFYLGLFHGYKKQEYYFEQTDFEKRLIEEFRERGEEICNNNKDDNDNEQIDCDDAQCGGKICGKGTITTEGENGTTIEIDFYCIAGTCQAKEEINETKGPVCGNHICEEGETVCSSSSVVCDENETECLSTADCGTIYCPQDCLECLEHDIAPCDGNLVKGGIDETGCPLPPVCVNETTSCESNEDCRDCGECVEGECKLKAWVIGEEKEKCNICKDGEKIIEKCPNGEEITSAVCMGGIWVYPDIWCEGVKEEVCCAYPGPDDRTSYEWRNKNNCESPEGSEFSEQIVSDSYCEKEKPKQDCNQHCWDDMSNKMPECPGDLKISGTYPDCNCEWVCDKIVNNECTTKEDCGGENDVCSNGKCETIHEKIPIKTPESGELPTTKPSPKPTPEPEPSEEQEEQPAEEEQQQEQQEQSEPSPEPPPEPATESEPAESPTTGAVIFAFFRGIFNSITQTARITGAAITGFETDETATDSGDSSIKTTSEPEPSPEPTPEPGPEPGPGPEPDNDCADKWKACGGPCPPCDYDKGPGGDGGDDYHDDSEDWERKDREEREMNEQENKERCEQECARPCIEKCIRESCGDEMDCNIDEESKKCEGDCSADESCIEKCMSGEEDWWKEFEDEHKEEKGVFQVGGGCRKEQGRTEGYIWFGGWGDPYEQIEALKHKYYEFGDEDWCKHEVDNLIKQRKEFEKGFNQEFAIWFFEKYLPNCGEDWEQCVSGIFELYWNNVDNQMQLSHNMQCLEKNNINDIMDVNLINIEYETDYGKLKYWEEIREVKMPGVDGKVTVISPYMEIWIYPPKSFIIYEMQEAMKNHEFPGPPEEKLERKNQEGPTEEEKELIRKDKKLMKDIRNAADKYGGNLNFVIQFVDRETNEIVFNLYAQVNEKDIMKVEPMLPEEVPQEDVRVEIDFEIMYDIILTSEKEMRGAQIESPPWDRKFQPVQKIKEVVNGVKMWFKMRKLMSSAKYYPTESEKDVKNIFKTFFKGMMGPGGEDRGPPTEKEIGEMKEQGMKKAEEMGIELSDEDLDKFEEMGQQGELDEGEIKRYLTGKAVFEKT